MSFNGYMFKQAVVHPCYEILLSKKRTNYFYAHQLECIFMLNENSQPQKSTFCTLPFIQHSCNTEGEQINSGHS